MFTSKIATIQDYKALLTAQAIEKNFWQLFNLKKACFFSFAILRCCKSKKKARIGIEQQELNSVANTPAKIEEQMRLNIGKKLKTACLNSRFACSKKRRVYFDLLTFENF